MAKGLREDFDFNIKPSTISSTFVPSTISSTYLTNNQEDNLGQAWASSLAHVVHDIYQSMNASTLHQLCINKILGFPTVLQDGYMLSLHCAFDCRVANNHSLSWMIVIVCNIHGPIHLFGAHGSIYFLF